MLSFAIRRILQTVPTVLAVVLVIFVLFSVVPGSIISSMSDDGRGPTDPQIVERMKKQLGLDDPVYIRFGAYIGKLATGDFGTSFRTREPVTTMIAKRLWPTLQLIFAARIFAIAIGVPLVCVGALMGQAVVVEKLFSWPGIGSLLVDSVLQRDIPAVQGSILVVVLFFLTINTMIDLLYGVIDPRIRYA